MKGKINKYLSEFASNIFSSKWMMIPASNLNPGWKVSISGYELAKSFQIYLIIKFPFLNINKETFMIEC